MVANVLVPLSPGQQQPWYWLCRIGRSLSSACKEWFQRPVQPQCWELIEMWIYFHVSKNIFSAIRVKYHRIPYQPLFFSEGMSPSGMIWTLTSLYQINTVTLIQKNSVHQRLTTQKLEHDTHTFEYSQPLSHVDGLVQERRYSSALAMELRFSCTNPSTSYCWLSARRKTAVTLVHYDCSTYQSHAKPSIYSVIHDMMTCHTNKN